MKIIIKYKDKYNKEIFIPTLTYVSESCKINERNKSKIQAPKMRCLRKVAKNTPLENLPEQKQLQCFRHVH